MPALAVRQMDLPVTERAESGTVVNERLNYLEVRIPGALQITEANVESSE
jgi:hypothetical protein